MEEKNNPESYWTAKYSATLSQAVNVLTHLTGVTQFDKTYAEFEMRLNRMTIDMRKEGAPMQQVLNSRKVIELRSRLFGLECTNLERKVENSFADWRFVEGAYVA